MDQRVRRRAARRAPWFGRAEGERQAGTASSVPVGLCAPCFPLLAQRWWACSFAVLCWANPEPGITQSTRFEANPQPGIPRAPFCLRGSPATHPAKHPGLGVACTCRQELGLTAQGLLWAGGLWCWALSAHLREYVSSRPSRHGGEMPMPGLGSSTDPPTKLALTLAVRPQRRGPGREADADPGRRRDGPPACDAQGSRSGEPGAGGRVGSVSWGRGVGFGQFWSWTGGQLVSNSARDVTQPHRCLRGFTLCVFYHVRRCAESDTLKL